MALSSTILAGNIKYELETNGFDVDNSEYLQTFLTAISSSIIDHIKMNGVVSVDPTSHTGVMT